MSEPVNEYEREPVPEGARLGLRSFVGQYAGEHVAGTELMIGPLFVAAGVGAVDLLLGLLVGNLLAVLSWRYMTAPIATRARLTLYYQLEKICGRSLVTLYNTANGVMFTFLAGAMITVAATALGVGFKFRMPGLGDLLPNSAGWVAAVLAMGVLFSLTAAFGYKALSRFAAVAAPWMIAVFAVFGLVGLRELGVHSFADFWPLAKERIWTGGAPLAGQVKFTIWHVMFFAWFCNMAWHIGMADLTVLRYAKKASYGFASAAGMFVGHTMAWVAASILFALQLHRDPSNTAVLPGPMAYGACGLAGLACVVIAGWTTATPTLYRAGLAFQAVSPGWSRFRVTLGIGLVATVTAVFPLVAMKLLDFVALWGLILMPMGAVLFMDYWVLPRLGLKTHFAAETGRKAYGPAAAAWFATVAVCLALVLSGKPWFQIYFVSLPGWFIASGLYVALSAMVQRGAHETAGFRRLARAVAVAALAGIVVPGLACLAGAADLARVKAVLLASTIAWFVSAPLGFSGREAGG
jgi:purine-cytosine permease-like protein